MYVLQIQHGHLSMAQAIIWLLKLGNDFSVLIVSGTSSHIFGDSEERLSLPKFKVFTFLHFRVYLLLRS